MCSIDFSVALASTSVLAVDGQSSQPTSHPVSPITTAASSNTHPHAQLRGLLHTIIIILKVWHEEPLFHGTVTFGVPARHCVCLASQQKEEHIRKVLIVVSVGCWSGWSRFSLIAV